MINNLNKGGRYSFSINVVGSEYDNSDRIIMIMIIIIPIRN